MFFAVNVMFTIVSLVEKVAGSTVQAEVVFNKYIKVCRWVYMIVDNVSVDSLVFAGLTREYSKKGEQSRWKAAFFQNLFYRGQFVLIFRPCVANRIFCVSGRCMIIVIFCSQVIRAIKVRCGVRTVAPDRLSLNKRAGMHCKAE